MPYLLFFILAFLWGCEKKIRLPIPNAASRVVIEAILSDSLGEAKVQLSNSTDINSNMASSPIHNAKVKIIEQGSNTEFDFQEKDGSGIYYCQKAKAIPNTNYRLSVNIDGKDYESIGKLPNKTQLMNVEILPDNANISGLRGQSSKGKDISLVVILNNSNHPSIQVAVNVIHKKQIVSSHIFSLRIPTKYARRMVFIPNLELSSKDSLIVNLQSISSELYNILLSIRNNSRQSKATPTTPLSNLTNGALGYFKICTSDTRTVKINSF